MIGLAAQRIDFAAHFLCDEAQLLTLSATAFERADKVFQVIGKTLLFFVDIEFLDVICLLYTSDAADE